MSNVTVKVASFGLATKLGTGKQRGTWNFCHWTFAYLRRVIVKHFAMLAVLFGLMSVSSGLAQDKNPVVEIDTSMGKIKVELFADKAPVTVKNFLKYVDDKHYDGTIFHRVISNFMIQGGGMLPGLKEKKTGAPIKNESSNGLSNKRGTIAMARLPDADSATAQFFINVKDNPGLNKSEDSAGYAVFGQ